MTIKETKKLLKQMYDVKNVENSFWYWFWKLYNIVIDVFDYENLPELIRKEDIENNLILLGYCGFLDYKGNLITPFADIFDFDFHYQPTKLIYANPRLIDYKTYKIGEDCEVVYNTSMKYRVWNIKVDGGLYSFISRYARMLADIESTINIYTVNSRLTSFPVADGDKTANSIKAFFEKISIGEKSVIADDSIINRFRNVDINRANVKDGINDWLIARDKTLEMFYRDIGVKMYNPKKAQVQDSEIEANDQLLLISIDDMLKARIEGLEKVNDMFGTDIRVKINDRFNIEKVGD